LQETDEKIAAADSDPVALRKLRKLRVKVLRGYMQQLSDDFNLICKAMKSVMVSSDVDRPDLAGPLMKQQLIFACGLMAMEVKQTIYGLGLTGGDISGLTRSVDAMRARVQSLASVAKPALVLQEVR